MYASGFLQDIHDADALQYHYKMPDTYGHIARLQGGLGGVSSCTWAISAVAVTSIFSFNKTLSTSRILLLSIPFLSEISTTFPSLMSFEGVYKASSYPQLILYNI